VIAKTTQVQLVNRLSKADGSRQYSVNADSSIRLRVAATTSPMRLQEHEVLQRHRSARRVSLHSVEGVDTELVGIVTHIIVSGKRVVGRVREQREVAVRIKVAIDEFHTASVYLPKMHTGAILEALSAKNKSLRTNHIVIAHVADCFAQSCKCLELKPLVQIQHK